MSTQESGQALGQTAEHAAEHAAEQSFGFPKFSDGDVTVTLSPTRVYHLHASVLRRNSSILAELLTEELGAKLCAKARKEGVTIRYHIQLCGDVNGIAKFEPREVDLWGRSRAPVGAFDIENAMTVNPIYKYYDNLFRTYYNKTPEFDETNLETVLRAIMGLLNVAEALQSVSWVTESCDLALLRQKQMLYRAIHRDAVAWIDLAYRLRSSVIFSEALIHVIGQWQNLSVNSKKDIKPVILKICKRKHFEQKRVKQAIEMRILAHYPKAIERVGQENVGRLSYQRDIYNWMAVALYRHWFAQAIIEENNFLAKDGGASFYRKIDKGGEAYLSREDIAPFFLYFPMTDRGTSCFQEALEAYKEQLKSYVDDLVTNRSLLDVKRYPVDHLTCLKVIQTDMPWHQQQVDEALMKQEDFNDSLMCAGMVRAEN